MRKFIPLCIVFVAFALTHAQEPASLDEIVQKRDSLLTQIVEATQHQRKAGTGTAEQVRIASINLYSFRRDSAKTQSERIQWQERIVASAKESHAAFKTSVTIGTATPMDALLAEERVLAAEQKLLELQLVK
jgi:hypothetical protein